MLRTEVSGDEAKHYMAVRKDNFQTIGGELVSANEVTGEVVVKQKVGDEIKDVTHLLGAGGIAIVARALILCAGLALGLSACAVATKLNMKLSGDIGNAQWLAQNGGDATGAMCLAALEPPFASAPDPTKDAVVATAERLRLLQMAVKKPECAQVIAPMLLQLEAQALPAPLGGILGAFSGS